jgi:hypothetical protein
LPDLVVVHDSGVALSVHSVSFHVLKLSVFCRIHRRLGTRPRKKESEMLSEILQPVLLIVVSYLVRLVFKAIKVELDDKTFMAIVAGLVAWLISLLGLSVAHGVAPTLF